MTDSMVLKFVAKENPNIVVDEYRRMLVGSVIDPNTVSEIFSKTITTGLTGKRKRDEIVFVASILRLFSPQTLLVGAKATTGVSEIIIERLEMETGNRNAAYHLIKVAKQLYDVDKVFKFNVDQIAGGYRNGD